MLKTLFFALLFCAASCCPQKPQYYGWDFQLVNNEGPTPVLYAKIDGKIALYHYAASEVRSYEKHYPELARGLVYIGCGRYWSCNGVLQNDTVGPDTYFWRKKY